jgi:ATP-dependent DNA helicase RecG
MKWTELKACTPKRIAALEQSGFFKPEDLLYCPPLRYEQPAALVSLSDLGATQGKITTVGTLVRLQTEGIGTRLRLIAHFRKEAHQQNPTNTSQVQQVHNPQASVRAVWFKGITWIQKSLEIGQWYQLTGQPTVWQGQLQLVHPELRPVSGPDAVNEPKNEGFLPIYPSNSLLKAASIDHHRLQGWIGEVLRTVTPSEFLPHQLLQSLDLPSLTEALHAIHQPKQDGVWERGLRRMRFAELFLFELAVIHLKHYRFDRTTSLVLPNAGTRARQLIEHLPFALTDAQKAVLRQIYADLHSGKSMHRLLQGDVGAGKTIVAIVAMLMMVDAGYQVALMAPTEILAEQHHQSIRTYLNGLGLDSALLTGSTPAKERATILGGLARGTLPIVVGTHALLEDQVQFQHLGLVVIDEQHRFGVMQRAKLPDKGPQPHLLVMSATPIPRSLALTLYGELEVSSIRELPAGRKPITTKIVYERGRSELYSYLAEQLEQGGQAYVVYPLVSESEVLDLKDATAGWQQLQAEFPQARVGLVHGRMKALEKETVMQAFKKGELQILVSTTVIEVGVDVPNASVMIIEHAERFGLSQLHQLRGRIGRGERQSYCFLMTDYKRSKDARERLAIMEKTNDGFEIAEADLRLRGPGDFLGTKQSGLPEFVFADLSRDQDLLEQAREAALQLLSEDPELKNEAHQALRAVFKPYLEQRLPLFQQS